MTYRLSIVQLGVVLKFETNKLGYITDVSGYLYPNSESHGYPITPLEEGLFLGNDNIFNKNPNFSENGFAFSVTDRTGLVTYYNVSSGKTTQLDPPVIGYNLVSFSVDINAIEPETVKTTIFWEKLDDCDEEDEKKENKHRKVRSEDVFDTTLEVNKYTKVYFVECPKVLLSGFFTTDKKNIVNNILFKFGDSVPSILNPEVFSGNNNVVKCDNLTYGGLGFTTSSSTANLSFMNIYKGEDGEYYLDISFSLDIQQEIVTVPLLSFTIKDVKVCK